MSFTTLATLTDTAHALRLFKLRHDTRAQYATPIRQQVRDAIHHLKWHTTKAVRRAACLELKAKASR